MTSSRIENSSRLISNYYPRYNFHLERHIVFTMNENVECRKDAWDRANSRNNFQEKRFDTIEVAQSVYHPLWYDVSQHHWQ